MSRSYAPQFRAMLVEQVRSGRKVGEVAAGLGVSPATVFRWVRQDRIAIRVRWLDERRSDSLWSG